ncbi:ubiquitin carboxyl-terminal hydrolase 20 isoform X2 [Parasteatoda tepidariorum]|uniref:ubiquitin carboxyl-terminal hydrolase 20 isoform X2 n=1 Tax=Parasteatoda tepidariorum TaxID=114398 RepID=UPI0039BCDA72
MSTPKSKCSHIHVIGDYTKEDIIGKQSKYKEHSIFLNLTSLRVYCLLCECEVFLENNDPPLPGMLPVHPLINKIDTDSEEDIEGSDENLKPRGLTGLQNLGNTCYMNSAIQALSNCPQLTNFFLECGSFVQSEKKASLSNSYMRLMKEMWHKKRPSYVVPSGVAYGIKIVCPVFRGYAQQDAQEFLRCFMDQLHEELKEPAVEISVISNGSPDSSEEFDSTRIDSGMPASEDSSQSDADYETCDSGMSSEKGSCADEGVFSEDANESVELLESVTSDLALNQTSKYSSNQRCMLNIEKPFLPDSDSIPSLHGKILLTGVEDKHKLSKNSELVGGSKNFVPTKCDYPHIHRKNDEANLVLEEDLLIDDNKCDDKDKCSKNDICDINLDDLKIEDSLPATQLNSSVSTEIDSGNTECGCSDVSQINQKNDSINKSFSGKQISQVKHMTSQNIISSILNLKKRKSLQYRSIISDIFDGKILSSVQCLTCDTISTTREAFQDLSLPIPNRDHLHMIHASHGSHQKSGGTCTDVYSHQGWFSSLFGWVMSWFWGPSVSLQDCLAAFFSADELKGDNMYSCEKCKKLRNGIKYSKVIELPEMLCIHLKRFRHEVMFSSKISSYVSFPMEGLDMSPFLHKSYPRGVTTYDLASVICHHGTAGSGHYTAYCLNYLNEQWYEFDDQYVTAVDAEMIRHSEAYVLFYRKTAEDMIKKRQCAVELMERSRIETGLLKFHISKQWVNKFNNFSEPGPISNTDFLCIHGGVPPHKASYADELCTVLPQAVWEYLHDTFGGGPPCTHLYICPICQAEQDNRNRKRRKELEDFTMMNAEFQHMENPVVYAISMSWFKTWENFVCKDQEQPGPIDNSSICYVKNNQAILKLGSDYCSVSKEMYLYLQNIYGGGPDITLQPNSRLSSRQVSSSSSVTSKPSQSTIQSAQVHASTISANVSSHSQTSSSVELLI